MSEELERDLGLLSVIAISMGAMIGSGIFILPGLAMAEAGPAVILAFVIAGLLVLPAAISIAELGTAMPEAGGDYIFIERGMGPGAGTIAGLGTWLMLMFKGALALVGGMLYLGPVFHRMGFAVTPLQLEVIAVVVGIVLIAINVIGVKQTGGLQKILVLVMLVILGGFVGLTLGNIEGDSYGGFFAEGQAGLLAATAMVLISYGGVTKVAAVAEEIERPGRNLPLGLLLSLGLTTGLYALIVFVLVGTVDAPTLEGSETPMVDGVDPFFGFVGVVLIVIAAMFALISTANAGILTASRYPFALSRDNLLPELFATVNDRFRTPVTAILTTGGAMLVIIIALPVEEIAKTAGAFQIVVYVLVCIALIAFRRRNPDWYEPEFRSPGYPWVQVFGVVAGIGILTQMDTLPLIGGVGIVLVGGLWYWVYGRPRVTRTGLVGEEIIETVEPTAPDVDADRDRIVVPIANPQTERDLMELAAAIAAARDRDAELVVTNVITVPDQTSLAQDVVYERQRVDRQQELLEAAEDIARELGVGLRTHAIVGRNVADAILRVVRQEAADEVVMGWSGTRKRRDRVLGSNIDRIIEEAPCEVTLIRPGGAPIGDVVGFIRQDPYADIVARKAWSLAATDSAGSLTFVNVQPTGEAADIDTVREAGRATIQEAVEGIDVQDYEMEVVVSGDIGTEIARIAAEYDTICLGVSQPGSVERILSGAISESIGEKVDGTIVLVRGKEQVRRSVVGALRRRVG